MMRITWGSTRAGGWQAYEQAYRATVADQACQACGGGGWPKTCTIPMGALPSACGTRLEAMQAYEQSAVFRQQIQPTLQPFLSGSTPPIGVR